MNCEEPTIIFSFSIGSRAASVKVYFNAPDHMAASSQDSDELERAACASYCLILAWLDCNDLV